MRVETLSATKMQLIYHIALLVSKEAKAAFKTVDTAVVYNRTTTPMTTPTETARDGRSQYSECAKEP